MSKYTLAAVLFLSACGQGEDTNPVVDETTDTIQNGEDGETALTWARITEPYFTVIPEAITVGDSKRPWITFDRDDAFEAGINAEAIEFAESLLKATQQVLQRETILNGELPLDPMVEQFFTQYGTSEEESHQSEENGIGTLIQAAHCGGTRQNPHNCNAMTYSNSTWQTEREVRTMLTNTGYWLTPRYGVFHDSEYGWDYTLPVFQPCGWGVFRIQAILERRPANQCPNAPMCPADRWSFRWQQDLNPTIFSEPLAGDWPHWWWPAYVAWWHGLFC